MSTTIRLDDDLKQRVAAAADRAGQTAHAFMLDAIASTVEQNELDAEFHRVADERWARFVSTGESVPWSDARAWINARANGENLPRPTALKPKR